jgi:hypothetical protein
MRRPEFIARQSSRPRGLVGRLLGHVMAIETASLNSQALELLGLQPSDRLLEVGFGHGRTIRLAAAQVPQGVRRRRGCVGGYGANGKPSLPRPD